jgi:hypothetical protein
MKALLSIIILVSTCSISFSQKRVTDKLKPEKSPNLKLAYLGRFSRNGIKAGAEFMVKNKKITINKKSGESLTRFKQHFVTANLSFYEHAAFNNVVTFHAEWLTRKTYSSGLFAEISAGVGISKGQLGNKQKTYLKKNDGALKLIKPDNTYFTLPLSFGLGYDFTKVKKMPFKIYAKGGLNTIYHHAFVYPNVMAEIGIIASLSAFKRK